ncbi:hypothetical protein COCCADRAFT_109304 [Bipolaris zeicola 26-R-13]|uniref:Uncharacterized protein n=1 Tax=Cochliobolus carbonum (strain 26-R-13) TaxID=930089 RepID=W6YB57_COCC2|nr:uncharacterized protein COCCADRAFT_109304 [Bipolaris zeicola 26-R-13]EUC28391.1 hypothetical protein COCCADRAFT_109304 [Bipolaris zeicola 26-R-13]
MGKYVYKTPPPFHTCPHSVPKTQSNPKRRRVNKSHTSLSITPAHCSHTEKT